MILRCGRLDGHPEHNWTVPRTPFRPARTWHCTGRVITSLAEQEWARVADNDERADDELRAALEGWGQ